MFKINGIQVDPTRFPDGTSQIWKLSEELFVAKVINIEWYFVNEGEIMHLAQINDLFRHTPRKNLYIDYLPYARQDKAISNDKTFAFLTFSKIINNMNFHEIKILDPHNVNICELTLNMFKEVKPTEFIDNTIMLLKPDAICFPDKGAKARYDWITHPWKVYGEKVRDQLTGEIKSITIHGRVDNKNVLIIDDICDAGGTFVGCAAALKNAGAKEINLYTTHGLYTKGLKVMKEAGISKFFSKKGEATIHRDYFNSPIYKPFKEI